MKVAFLMGGSYLTEYIQKKGVLEPEYLPDRSHLSSSAVNPPLWRAHRFLQS
jgi:hypothetical protein